MFGDLEVCFYGEVPPTSLLFLLQGANRRAAVAVSGGAAERPMEPKGFAPPVASLRFLFLVKLKSNRNKRWLNARGARLGVLKMDRKGGFLGWRKGLAGEKGGKGGGLVWWRGCEGA